LGRVVGVTASISEWRMIHDEKGSGTRRAETVRDGRDGIGFLANVIPHQRAE
jgi:hypothetical protein